MTDPVPTPVPTPAEPPAEPSRGKRRILTPEERAQRAEAARLRREARAAAAPVAAAPVPAAPVAAAPVPAAPVPAAPVPATAPQPTPGQVVRSSGIRRPARATPVYVSSGRKRQVLIPARKRIVTHTISTPTSSRPK